MSLNRTFTAIFVATAWVIYFFPQQVNAQAEPQKTTQISTYANQPPTPPNAPPEPPGPPPLFHPEIKLLTQDEWQKIEIVGVTTEELAGLYRKLLATHLIAGIDANDPAYSGNPTKYEDAKKIAAETAARGYYSSYQQFEDIEGEWWYFNGIDGDVAPQHAFKLTFPDKNNYIAKFQIYCLKQDDTCEEFIDQVKAIPAFNPPSEGFDKRYLEWHLIRSDGPCLTKRPFAKPSPVFPNAALLEKKTGEVMVQFSTDSCGIPVEVKIYKSSNNRDLDKAAINAVRQWRVDLSDMPHARGEFRTVVVPIKFIAN